VEWKREGREGLDQGEGRWGREGRGWIEMDGGRGVIRVFLREGRTMR
jgi:hypothetical protein